MSNTSKKIVLVSICIVILSIATYQLYHEQQYGVITYLPSYLSGKELPSDTVITVDCEITDSLDAAPLLIIRRLQEIKINEITEHASKVFDIKENLDISQSEDCVRIRDLSPRERVVYFDINNFNYGDLSKQGKISTWNEVEVKKFSDSYYKKILSMWEVNEDLDFQYITTKPSTEETFVTVNGTETTYVTELSSVYQAYYKDIPLFGDAISICSSNGNLVYIEAHNPKLYTKGVQFVAKNSDEAIFEFSKRVISEEPSSKRDGEIIVKSVKIGYLQGYYYNKDTALPLVYKIEGIFRYRYKEDGVLVTEPFVDYVLATH